MSNIELALEQRENDVKQQLQTKFFVLTWQDLRRFAARSSHLLKTSNVWLVEQRRWNDVLYQLQIKLIEDSSGF